MKTGPSEGSPLALLLWDELDAGTAMAKDPENANLPDFFRRQTTVYSPWFARRCRQCKDVFREGDQVRLCPTCKATFHDDHQYALYCWQKRFAGGGTCGCGAAWSETMDDTPAPDGGDVPHAAPPEVLVNQFLCGLEGGRGSFGKHAAFRVPPDSPLIGRRCPYCRYEVRVGDWVVACPCGRDGDEPCSTHFHQDVFRHLPCWNNWHGGQGKDHCPDTMRRYERTTGG